MFYCKFMREDNSVLIEKTLNSLPRLGELVRINCVCYTILSITYDYDCIATLVPEDYSYFPEIEGTNVDIKLGVI